MGVVDLEAYRRRRELRREIPLAFSFARCAARQGNPALRERILFELLRSGAQRRPQGRGQAKGRLVRLTRLAAGRERAGSGSRRGKKA